MIREEISHNIKDMIGKTHGEDIVSAMEKISEFIEQSNFNGITFLSNPESANILVAVQFAKILDIEISNGEPILDLEKYSNMNDANKIKSIELILNNVAAILESFRLISARFFNFSERLIHEKKILEAKLGKANQNPN